MINDPRGLRLMHDRFPGCPDFIPRERLTERHDRRAQLNHSQTLQRLNERGGLSPLEFRAVVLDKDWYELHGDGHRGNGINFEHYYDAVNFVRGFLELGALPGATDPAIVQWRQRMRL